MRIAICDDEVTAIEAYTRDLQQVCRDNDIEADFTKYKSGDQLLFFTEDVVRDTDILFLDVGMPGTNGIETARKLRENGYEGEIIFLTSSREAVFYAFDVRATNYLVKEMASEKRLREVFLRAVESAREKRSEYLLLTGIGEYRNIRIDEIRYFEVSQKIVTVYYRDTNFEFVSTIGKLENLLFSRGFVRISRSCIVAARYVESFAYEKVTMTTGESLPVGRKYYKELKKTMKGGRDERQDERE
ncbi:hypothetical protein BHK98_08560 [Hornefia porci]|uniref:Stage 0 sporulation protein A homolog n=1 Tax=Hornefia porci TaxID=2652292 RepID=A0A1Q9JIZ6_9FIRM|nr:LytTR family DNA-binding domain-containing protein [Hornefia porci]OLR56111.1 hypothetical protein BHK98_08560 [Hornefia porci]